MLNVCEPKSIAVPVFTAGRPAPRPPARPRPALAAHQARHAELAPVPSRARRHSVLLLEQEDRLVPAPVSVSALHPDVTKFVARLYQAAREECVSSTGISLSCLSPDRLEQAATVLNALRAAIARADRDLLVPLTAAYDALLPRAHTITANGQAGIIDSIAKADAEEERLRRIGDLLPVQDAWDMDAIGRCDALGTQICALSRRDEKFQRIAQKIADTHSWRQDFRLRVHRVFALHLPAERSRFQAEREAIGNVQELFHGTATANLLGILTRGLRIAPCHAPCKTLPFGRGIHFGDQSSVSALSCLPEGKGAASTRRKQTGYLLLADVALGQVKKAKIACYREHAPAGYDSMQGCRGLSLPHNTFVIYRPEQCTLRYAVEVEALSV